MELSPTYVGGLCKGRLLRLSAMTLYRSSFLCPVSHFREHLARYFSPWSGLSSHLAVI
jgi:hypothetical protein